MMKRLLCAGPLLCSLHATHAQPAWTLKENSRWKFYQYGGLSFVNNLPVTDTSAMRWQYNNDTPPVSTINAASVSDAEGNLLFYTDAYHVWDKDHHVMPGGTGLSGGNALDATVILPVIDSPKQYYIFYMCGNIDFLGASANAYELRYSIVDMNLNNGKGDVVPGFKNILLEDNLSGSMKAVPGSSCNVWLITHDLYNTEFKVFEISHTGVSANPVSSTVGNGQVGFMGPLSFGGNMAVSNNGNKIAFAQNGGELVPIVELFDFNPATAAVSNAAVIDTQSFAFGFSLCFSPDNSKLYLSMLNPGELHAGNPDNVHVESSLFQYNLSLGSPSAIHSSRVLLSDSVSSYNNIMRLGPDGKIYLPASYGGDVSPAPGYFYPSTSDPGSYSGPAFQAYLGCIQSPNTAGAGSNFNRHAIALPAYSSGAEALGGVFVKPVQADSSYVRHDTAACNPLNGTVALHAPGSSFNFTWDDGSTGSQRMVNAPGTYWVRNGNYCQYRVDTFVVDIAAINAVIQQNGNTLSTTAPFDTYQWYLNSDPIPGATGSTYTILQSGVYLVIVTDGSCSDTSAVFNAQLSGIGEIPSWVQQVNIYPNPARDVLYIRSPKKVNATVSSVEGKVLLRQEAAKTISLSGLTEGLYFLQLRDQDGRLLRTEKFVKSTR